MTTDGQNKRNVLRSSEHSLPSTSLFEMKGLCKNAEGVEVHTRETPPITFRDLMESETWRHATQECCLPLALGRDVAGSELVRDLVDAPHLLVAGCAGSGKTTFLRAIVSGFLMSRTPQQVRLILVDTRREAFAGFNRLPYLVFPVINKLSDVRFCLRWAAGEADMRRRYLDELGVRTINDITPDIRVRWLMKQVRAITEDRGLTRKMGNPDWTLPLYLPEIVIVVDELSDIMLEIGKDVEETLRRLIPRAHEVGIHLILATQRPRSDVITDEIKALIPGRVAFKMEVAVYSKVILESPGAEELRGNGDMLIRWQPEAPLIRAQGSWININKIVIVTAHWRRQWWKPSRYNEGR